ncbi:steroid dehydrogenase [Chloropicon primus]|nr:steroid dehydrogenase [Chloropicon primus]
MLAERGAKVVVSFDIAPKPKDAKKKIKGCEIVYVQGDLTKYPMLVSAFEGCDCVWHIAALVGPYHDYKKYYEVNYKGTLNVINACKELGIHKIVMSSSPSTRFDGNDVVGKGVEDLDFPKKYTHAYAETKAMGERAMSAACDGEDLLTVAIAPHQVYGPRDMLFLHNFLVARKKLRIIGGGKNKISMTHVDNYCHGLILGEEALYPGSPALGKFYIVTDKEPQYLWKVLDNAFVTLGYNSLYSRMAVPGWLITPIAHLVAFAGYLLGRKFKLNPFAVRMLMIHRWFDISAAERDLKYAPVLSFEDGWKDTLAWFKQNWMPLYDPLHQ